jgi:hypothetical protein
MVATSTSTRPSGSADAAHLAQLPTKVSAPQLDPYSILRDFSAYRLEHDESVKPVRDETERLQYGFAR